MKRTSGLEMLFGLGAEGNESPITGSSPVNIYLFEAQPETRDKYHSMLLLRGVSACERRGKR
jgi:hypothetical protein